MSHSGVSLGQTHVERGSQTFFRKKKTGMVYDGPWPTARGDGGGKCRISVVETIAVTGQRTSPLPPASSPLNLKVAKDEIH